MTPAVRRAVFLVAAGGLVAFLLWGVSGLPAFGQYHGPYGSIVNSVAVAQTHATGVVSAVNFDYRGLDTLGEEFILFIAATGVATILRQLRGERETSGVDAASGREVPATSDAVRMAALAFAGPVLVVGWFLTTHAQTNPSGGFQGGVVMASALFLVYLAGQFLAFKRLSPVDVTDAVEAVGAGGFALVGLAALATGAAFLTDVLPLGSSPGEVDASGTIVVVSVLVGVEVTAAFLLIANELLEQTIVIRRGDRQ
jgi:multicomponent Na+:H+ antiporter subunit B